MNQKHIFLIFLALIILSAVPVSAANATNFSVSDLGIVSTQTLMMYCGNTYIGSYNTTQENIPVPDCDFSLVLKPERKTMRVEDQLTDLIVFLGAYWIYIVFGLAGVYVLTRRI